MTTLLTSGGAPGHGTEEQMELLKVSDEIRRVQTGPAGPRSGSSLGDFGLADSPLQRRSSDPVRAPSLRPQDRHQSLPTLGPSAKSRRSLPALTLVPAIKRDTAAIKNGRLATNAHILGDLLLDPINMLLVAAPFGVLGESRGWPDGLTFVLCFLALVPLAKLLGDATEHLAENLNQTIGGLLNATFGNAVEMIITINAIKNGLLDIVKSSLLGSILSNLLLVLGMAFFAGGLVKPEQKFSGAAALINITMLLVGVMSFSLPTVFSFGKPEGASLEVSRVSAIFVSVGYVAYLVFQLHTHVEIFEDDNDDDQKDLDCEVDAEAATSGDSSASMPLVPGVLLADDAESPDAEAEDGVLSVPWALGLLLVSTVAVAALSEVMVDSIDGMVEAWRVPRSFVGVILLPIVGNACEHASAVRMAYNSKMGAAIAIAVGSSTQIAMFVMPFSVLAGWMIGQPLDLNLGATGLAVMILSVLVVFSIVMDGKSNWLEGFLLTLAYCLVAVLYWYAD
jgi:Ca2+:H+ antiporter